MFELMKNSPWRLGEALLREVGRGETDISDTREGRGAPFPSDRVLEESSHLSHLGGQVGTQTG